MVLNETKHTEEHSKGMHKVEKGHFLSNQRKETESTLTNANYIKNIPQISIIIPVFNESEGIISVLDQIIVKLKDSFPYKIIIIDDNSQDNTWDLVNHYQKSHPDVDFILIQNKTNLGKSKSLVGGFKFIKPDELVVLIDGDGEHQPHDIPKLLRPIITQNYQVVFGSRFKKYYLGQILLKSTYLQNGKRFSKLRQFGNKVLSLLVNLFHKKYISDTQCGYRAMKGSILKNFKPIFNGFAFETEFTLHCISNHYNFTEVSINTGLSTRESHMSIIRDSSKILLVIMYYFSLQMAHAKFLQDICRRLYSNL